MTCFLSFYTTPAQSKSNLTPHHPTRVGHDHWGGGGVGKTGPYIAPRRPKHIHYIYMLLNSIADMKGIARYTLEERSCSILLPHCENVDGKDESVAS